MTPGMQLLQKGENPRDTLSNHRERGRRKYHFTYDDYASLLDMSVDSVRRAVCRGSFDPSSLASVVAFWCARNRGLELSKLLRTLSNCGVEDTDETLVFLIRDGSHTMIGVSSDPWRHLTKIQRGNPRRLSMLACTQGTAQDVEVLHDRYAEHRVSGAWYRIPKDDLAALVADLRSFVQ